MQKKIHWPGFKASNINTQWVPPVYCLFALHLRLGDNTDIPMGSDKKPSLSFTGGPKINAAYKDRKFLDNNCVTSNTKEKLWPQPTFINKGQVTGIQTSILIGLQWDTRGGRSEKFAWGSRLHPHRTVASTPPRCHAREDNMERSDDHPSQSRNRNQERNLDSPLRPDRNEAARKKRESNRETPPYLWRRNNLNGTTVIRNYWNQKVTHHFSRAKRKEESSTQNSCM